MTVSTKTLSGLSALSADDNSAEAKKAKIEDFGKFSGKVDQELLEHATELAQLVAVGGVTCAELDEYNAIALAVWKANYLVFSELIRAGADRSTLLSPFQPAFFTTPGGVEMPIECPRKGENCQSARILSACPGGTLSQNIGINADSRYSDIFFPLQPERPVASALEGLGLAVVPAIIWGIAILTAGTAAVLLTSEVLGFFDGSTADRATAELTVARSKIATASFKARRECIQFGGTASECTRATRDQFKAPASPAGFLDRVVGATFKVGGMFLVGSFLLKKIQDR